MKKLLLLLLLVLLFFPTFLFAQQQIGQTIFDDDSQQNSEVVGTNEDGSIIIIGYPISSGGGLSGEVKVFQFLNNTWSQIGNTIPGMLSGDSFGTSVSINSQGNIIAIGAPFNNGPSSGGNDVGYTKVLTNF